MREKNKQDRIGLGNSVTPSNILTFTLQGSQKKKKREKGAEHLLEKNDS